MTNSPVVLTYLDAYQKERQVSYDNIDHCLLSFSGCVTIPDSYQVVSVTYKGQTLPFTGRIGDFYRYLIQFDQSLRNSN